jgi:hypothetical protein
MTILDVLTLFLNGYMACTLFGCIVIWPIGYLTIWVIWLYCYMAHGLFGYLVIWLYCPIRLFDFSNMAYGLFHIFTFFGSNFFNLKFEILGF